MSTAQMRADDPEADWIFAGRELLKERQRTGSTFVILLEPQTSASTVVWSNYVDDLVLNLKRPSAPVRNWLARIGQIKAEIQGLVDGGSKAPPAQAMKKIDHLRGALAGTKEPIFEVDPDDGEISILWNDDVNRRSVALRLDGTDFVRVVGFVHGAAKQPESHKVRVRSAIEAVSVQQILSDPDFRDIVQG